MYVRPDSRSRGVAGGSWWRWKRRRGRSAIKGTARHRSQAGARARLYRAVGYVEVPPYNDNPFACFWGEKALDYGSVASMTHAAVVQVVLDPSADLAHRHSVLEQFVLPELTAMPGYRRSTWLNTVRVRAPALWCSTRRPRRRQGSQHSPGRAVRRSPRPACTQWRRRPEVRLGNLANGLYCGGVGTQVTIVGGGSYQWGPELMADLFGTPALAGMHLVSKTSTRHRCRRWRRWRTSSRTPWMPRRPSRRPPTSRRPSTGPTSSSCASRPGDSALWRSTSTCRLPTASPDSR